jgi:hypothetical protein
MPARKAKPKPAHIPVPEVAGELSRETYADRRDERIAYYYFVRRVTKPPAIYDFMIHECRECLSPDVGSAHTDPQSRHAFTPLISRNRASGLRMIQLVVMRLRAEAEPEEVLALRRPIETEKVRKTYEYLLQKQIDVIEDNSMVKVQKLSPSGQIVTVLEPRCSKLDKGKAVKAAALLNEKIGKLTGAALVAVDQPETPGRGAGAAQEPSFTFSFPNVKGGAGGEVDALIAMNLDAGKVN